MKYILIVCCIGVFVFVGAGCSKKSTVATQQNSTAKEALIQRRTSEPPKPPENVPLPTPVNGVEVVK